MCQTQRLCRPTNLYIKLHWYSISQNGPICLVGMTHLMPQKLESQMVPLQSWGPTEWFAGKGSMLFDIENHCTSKWGEHIYEVVLYGWFESFDFVFGIQCTTVSRPFLFRHKAEDSGLMNMIADPNHCKPSLQTTKHHDCAGRKISGFTFRPFIKHVIATI